MKPVHLSAAATTTPSPVGVAPPPDLRRRLADAQTEVAHLKIALQTSRGIGIAIGVLMSTHRCTASDALSRLQKASQNQNRKLRDIAIDVQYAGAIVDRARRST